MDSKEKVFAGLVRRCLTQRYILRARNRDVFSGLILNEASLSEYFGKMGVQLVTNDILGVAYLQPMAEFDEEIGCQLGRKKRLSALESVALIKLRSKRMEFFSGSIDHETPMIPRQEIRDFLRDFLPLLEERDFERQFNAVLRSLVDHRMLHECESGQFEITAVCDILLPGDQIRILLDRAKAYFNLEEGELE